MNCRYLILAAAALMLLCGSTAVFATPVLGSAQDFAVLGSSTVTNTGSTTLTGDLGVYAGSAITGFFGTVENDGPGTFTGTSHQADAAALLAHNDLIVAYNALATYGTPTDLTGQDLGGLTLTSGVYHFDTTAQLTGTLKLDAANTNGGFWVFQIGTDLTTASASVVQFINPGNNFGSDVGVFWVLGTSGTAGLGSATLGGSTAFEGNILALTSISLDGSATIENGRALAINGAVTMISNDISNVCPPPNGGPGFSGGLGFDEAGALVPISAIPEPGTLALVIPAIMGFAGLAIRRMVRR